MEKNWVSWFEIPVTDFDRARAFYEIIFEIELHALDLGALKMGIFPGAQGGAICQGEVYHPGAFGPVIYLRAEPDLQLVLDRIPLAGGKILQQKKHISDAMGFMALFNDSEGNRLALHSMR